MIESRSTIWPSHPLPDNKAGQGRAGQRCALCGTARNGTALYMHGIHAVLVCTVRKDVLGSETRNSTLGELGLDTGFFCCGGQIAC